MIKFLVYVAIILAVLAVGYLVRVFELAQSLKGKRSEEITDKDNQNMAKVMLGLLVFLFGFTIWQLKEYGGKLLPEAASIHGVETDKLLNFSFVTTDASDNGSDDPLRVRWGRSYMPAA